MNRMITQVYDKVLFVSALVAAGVSGWWLWRQQDAIRRLKREQTMTVVSVSGYSGAQWRLPEGPAVEWRAPPAQSRGKEWMFDVFTPPAVSYNPGARSFAVQPADGVAEPAMAGPGLELLAVKREPYRLQLLGYLGEAGDYLGAFACSLSGETLLARRGHRFESLGLILKSLEVRKVNVEGGEAGLGSEVAAFAAMEEENTGTEVMLDSRARRLTDTPLAVFRVPGGKGPSRDLREGDTFLSDATLYRIERIQLDPPEVVVARATPGRSQSELKVLRPANQVVGREGTPQSPVPQAVADVAHNAQELPSP